MNRGRRGTEPPTGRTGSPLEQQTTKAKAKRLSRSFRQTQQELDSPLRQHSDFKTPTRVPRSRPAGPFRGESPHNDSDFQQDIIWDATSPSPRRLGKTGKRHSAGVVDISEIVSRIAPKHGRPRVAEPTLQQWIGDSAAIPCTPDVQAPKTKKKSPRPNGVDDLLKLAKQFDLNMFHQFEEEVEDMQLHSLALLSEDILDFENTAQNKFSPSLPGTCQPAASKVAAAVAAGTDVQLHAEQETEDDLDFLFDGPTQQASGSFSQASSAQPSQVKPALTSPSREAAGKPAASSLGPFSGVTTTNGNAATAGVEFEDDWENDDLLNDSLVLEMAAPARSSTQKAASRRTSHERETPAPASAAVRLAQMAGSKVKENVRPRTTFRLESNPDFCVRRTETDTRTSWQPGRSSQTANAQRRSRFPQSGSATASRGDRRTSAAPASNASAAHKPHAVSSHRDAPAVCDFLDDDLDYYFSLDPVWDDPADDDLLCEMCDNLENEMRTAENVSAKRTPLIGQLSNQRAALQPASRGQQPTPPGQTACGRVSSVTVQVNPFRFTQTETVPGSTASSPRLQRSSGVQRAAAAQRPLQQHAFHKPNYPVSMVTHKAVAKCSAAEIELKKQQAMARRRQRLQAAQNPRAPT